MLVFIKPVPRSDVGRANFAIALSAATIYNSYKYICACAATLSVSTLPTSVLKLILEHICTFACTHGQLGSSFDFGSP